MPDSMKAKNIDETVITRDSLATPKSDAQGINKDVADKEIEVEVEVENVERPVDLYKVILVAVWVHTILAFCILILFF